MLAVWVWGGWHNAKLMLMGLQQYGNEYGYFGDERAIVFSFLFFFSFFSQTKYFTPGDQNDPRRESN